MFQLKAPRKIVSTVQLWVSVALIVLALIFSMMPIISFDLYTPDEALEDMLGGEVDAGEADFTEKVAEMMEELGLYVEIPEKVNVSLPTLIGSVSLIFKVVGAAGDGEDAAKNQAELNEYLETESGKQAVATAVTIAAAVLGCINFEEAGSNVMSFVLNTMISLIGLIAVLILTIVIPIMMIVAAIKAVLQAVRNKDNPEAVCGDIAGVLPGKITLVLTFMLFQCVVPGMTYGWGIMAICILGIIGVVLNFAASRLREYPNDQFVYLNVLQGGALVAMIGFLVFFFNIVSSGIFKSFVSGKFSAYLQSAIEYATAEVSVNGSYIIDAVLMLIYLVVMLSCTSYFDKAARRFSCTVRSERPGGLIGLAFKGSKKDNNIVFAVILFVAYLFPTLVAGFKHYYLNPTSTAAEGDASFLELTAAQQGALTGALVGIIIMIVAEVAVIVLKNVFCKNLSAQAAEAVMDGSAKTSDEIVADAQKIVDEAAAKAAPAAEAAPVAEEAPEAEEAANDEANV